DETTEHALRKSYFANIELPSSATAVARRAGVSLLPWYGGQPERANLAPMWEPTSIRTGSIALALAFAALLLAPRRDTWFFLLLAVFCTWVGLNAWPVAHVLHRLPLFDITLNERLANAAAFSIAILAAIAVDAWPVTRERGLRAAGVIVAIAIALGIATFMLRDAQIAQGVKPGLITVLTLAELVPLAAIALLLFLRTPQRIALPAMLGLLLLQRTLEDGAIYPKLPASAFYPPIPILTYLQNDRGEPFRIAPLHFAFLPDAAALYGLDDARGYEAMSFRRLEETYPLWAVKNGPNFNNIPDKTRPFLSLINVKYAIGSLREEPNEQWKLVLQDRQSRLFLNTSVLPRAFVPRSIQYVPEGTGLPSPVPDDIDFAERAWISAPEYASHGIANGPGTLRIQRPASGEFDIAATMQNDGWVVISESAWPGWRAYVDGKRVKTHYANHAFLGVFVPKGTHRLRVVYQPEAFTRGRNITLLTVVALVVFFALRCRRRLQQPRAVRV
ncbi:MAG TPA: YfhO family protein, partial [Thermoanaerobaculia bacterium]